MNDILVNDNGSIIIKNGDFAIGHSNQQHQKHLLQFTKGSLKEHITTGVGAAQFIESEDVAALLREIHVQFSGDGMTVQEIKIDDQGKLNILADYK